MPDSKTKAPNGFSALVDDPRELTIEYRSWDMGCVIPLVAIGAGLAIVTFLPATLNLRSRTACSPI
jgi:hypothetical protein